MANFKTKTKLQADAGILLPQETAQRVLTTDANGDVKSSGVSTTSLSYLDATSSIQGQLDTKLEESDVAVLRTDVEDLIELSGVPAGSVDLGTFSGTIIPDASTIKEAIQALELEIESLPTPFHYAGTYNPATNTPDLDDAGARVSGAVYYVTADGTHDFGAFGGSISFNIGDKVVFNGTTWDKWDHTDQVASVFGRTGAVIAQSGDYNASQVDFAPSGSISATDTQAAIEELDADLSDLGADIADISQDVADLVTLSGVPANSQNLGTFTGVTIPDASSVKQALQSLETASESNAALILDVSQDLQDHIADPTGAHAASAISVIPAGNLTSTDVQAALEEIQTELDNFQPGSPGDIPEDDFLGANDQQTLANITGFAFSNAVVRSFEALVSVHLDATADAFEVFSLRGIQKASGWDMSVTATGDDSGVSFDINASGQVMYTSEDALGFVSLKMSFRAITTSI